jgi:hypothetical protein
VQTHEPGKSAVPVQFCVTPKLKIGLKGKNANNEPWYKQQRNMFVNDRRSENSEQNLSNKQLFTNCYKIITKHFSITLTVFKQPQ